MRIIQTYNTDMGKNLEMGFSSRQSFILFLQDSVKKHLENYDLTIYCDKEGYEFLKKYIDVSVLEVFEFKNKDGRFWNASKIEVQMIQTECCIHVDIDACIYELIEFDYVLTEMYRRPVFQRICHKLNIKPQKEIVCSGIIGFADIALKNKYCSGFFEFIKNWKLPYVDNECLWTIEETYLTSIMDKRAKEMPKNSYIHLQGGKK